MKPNGKPDCRPILLQKDWLSFIISNRRNDMRYNVALMKMSDTSTSSSADNANGEKEEYGIPVCSNQSIKFREENDLLLRLDTLEIQQRLRQLLVPGKYELHINAKNGAPGEEGTSVVELTLNNDHIQAILANNPEDRIEKSSAPRLKLEWCEPDPPPSLLSRLNSSQLAEKVKGSLAMLQRRCESWKNRKVSRFRIYRRFLRMRWCPTSAPMKQFTLTNYVPPTPQKVTWKIRAVTLTHRQFILVNYLPPSPKKVVWKIRAVVRIGKRLEHVIVLSGKLLVEERKLLGMGSRAFIRVPRAETRRFAVTPDGILFEESWRKSREAWPLVTVPWQSPRHPVPKFTESLVKRAIWWPRVAIADTTQQLTQQHSTERQEEEMQTLEWKIVAINETDQGLGIIPITEPEVPADTLYVGRIHKLEPDGQRKFLVDRKEFKSPLELEQVHLPEQTQLYCSVEFKGRPESAYQAEFYIKAGKIIWGTMPESEQKPAEKPAAPKPNPPTIRLPVLPKLNPPPKPTEEAAPRPPAPKPLPNVQIGGMTLLEDSSGVTFRANPPEHRHFQGKLYRIDVNRNRQLLRSPAFEGNKFAFVSGELQEKQNYELEIAGRTSPEVQPPQELGPAARLTFHFANGKTAANAYVAPPPPPTQTPPPNPPVQSAPNQGAEIATAIAEGLKVVVTGIADSNRQLCTTVVDAVTKNNTTVLGAVQTISTEIAASNKAMAQSNANVLTAVQGIARSNEAIAASMTKIAQGNAGADQVSAATTQALRTLGADSKEALRQNAEALRQVVERVREKPASETDREEKDKQKAERHHLVLAGSPLIWLLILGVAAIMFAFWLHGNKPQASVGSSEMDDFAKKVLTDQIDMAHAIQKDNVDKEREISNLRSDLAAQKALAEAAASTNALVRGNQGVIIFGNVGTNNAIVVANGSTNGIGIMSSQEVCPKPCPKVEKPPCIKAPELPKTEPKPEPRQCPPPRIQVPPSTPRMAPGFQAPNCYIPWQQPRVVVRIPVPNNFFVRGPYGYHERGRCYSY